MREAFPVFGKNITIQAIHIFMRGVVAFIFTILKSNMHIVLFQQKVKIFPIR